MTIKSILQSLNITPKNTLFTLLFFTGLYLSVLEVELYRKTFIPLSIPLLIWILTGLFITPFFLKTLPDYLKTEIFIYQIAFNTVTWGGIVTYLFMALNCYGARAGTTSATLIATGSGYLAKGRYGCGDPYEEVSYNALNKQLFFPCGTVVKTSDIINVTLKEGFFKYDVIVDQKLSKAKVNY